MWFAASGIEGFLCVGCVGCGVFVEACFIPGIFLNISGVQVWSGRVCMFFLVVFPLLPPSWGGGRRPLSASLLLFLREAFRGGVAADMGGGVGVVSIKFSWFPFLCHGHEGTNYVTRSWASDEANIRTIKRAIPTLAPGRVSIFEHQVSPRNCITRP